MNNYQNLSLNQMMGANQTPHIGNTQLITCPVCNGYGILQGAKCSCCNGAKQVRMTANGALFPLSAFD